MFKNYDQLVKNGQSPELQQKRKDALEILSAAVEAVDPYLAVEQVLQNNKIIVGSKTFELSRFDRIFVVGFGKASVKMAQAVCDAVPVKKGVVITNDSSATVTHESIEVIVGGHPLPDEGSVRGTEKILAMLREVGTNDCMIVLISGGGSALFCKPRVPLQDLQKTTELLLRSGARITEFNTIRKHLSFVKGGQLAQHINGVCISLVISDIVHDPFSSIASGPTYPDSSTFSDAQSILKKYDLWMEVPAAVRDVIEKGIAGKIHETPKSSDPVFQRMSHVIVANNEQACKGAIKKAQELGYEARLLTTSLVGEAREIGTYIVTQAKHSVSSGKTVFISGGEPTVTVQGHGSGGRNQELVLGCVEELAGTEMVVASCATDGIDGNSNAAGAIADGKSVARARKKNLDPSDYLKENDSNGFFVHLDDMLLTGGTGTNVMDIQIIIR